jgi:RNA polymerase sigma-70 factor, ECF subfamily
LEKEFIGTINDHQGIILKVCRMYTDNSLDSQDLFQEVVLQLWKSYPRFRGESKISTWMYRVALNTAITRLQRNKRRPDSQRLSSGQDTLESTDKRLDIEYDAELQYAINQLNKFDRAIVMLYLDEKSYKEIGEIMDISESHVGVKINRIKSKLKDILNP